MAPTQPLDKPLLRGVNQTHLALVFPRRIRRLAETIERMIPPDAATLLDVGCGSGDVARLIQDRRPPLKVSGIDVLVRPQTAIPVTAFDGRSIPFPDGAFDVVSLIDVLHHVNDPVGLLKECARVARQRVLIKDHVQKGVFDRAVLRIMDWVGNASYGVHLEYQYFSPSEWEDAFRQAGLNRVDHDDRLGLYPFPASLAFERHLHFVGAYGKA
jgi:ubiquinone/menaquinone biosynthesis C-methylase UbiE